MKERDYCGNTSEDEVVLKERRMRRPPKKFTPSSPKQDEISVIDLSGSDSKYNNKVQKLYILIINIKIYFFLLGEVQNVLFYHHLRNKFRKKKKILVERNCMLQEMNLFKI